MQLLSGDIYLNNKDATQWVPVDNTLTGSCKPNYETLALYNGTTVYGAAGGTDLSDPVCDGKSITWANGNYEWSLKTPR